MGKHDIEFISFLSKLLAGLIEATKEMNSWLEKGLWSKKQRLVRSSSFSSTPEDWQLKKIFLNYRLRTSWHALRQEMSTFGSMCNNFNIFLTHQWCSLWAKKKGKPWSPNLRTQSKGGNINERYQFSVTYARLFEKRWSSFQRSGLFFVFTDSFLLFFFFGFLFTFLCRKVEQPVFIQMFKYLSNRLQNWSKMNHPVRDSCWAFTQVRNKTRNSITRLEKVERSDFLMKRFPNATSQFYVKLPYRKSSAQCPHVFVSSKTNLANRPQLVFFINFRVRVRAVCNCFLRLP